MLAKISRGGVSTVQEVEALPNNQYRIASTGLIINPSAYDATVTPATIAELNSLTQIDYRHGEVMLYGLRLR